MSNTKRVQLREADSIEAFSLVDNTVDFLSTTGRKEVQSFRQWTQKRSKAMSHTLPFAEHGFSMLIRVWKGGKSTSILFDTGCSPDCVVKNAECMGMDLKEVEYIVLSHGHYDHTGGLLSALKAIGKASLFWSLETRFWLRVRFLGKQALKRATSNTGRWLRVCGGRTL
jgi:7,8-dihydropterin-6-yl-methyl-4-(beta-D-ribofuranosyl)aminobenzene 5'-phosphate synthase